MRQDPETVPSEAQVLELLIHRLRESLAQETAETGNRNKKQKSTEESLPGSDGLRVPKDVLDEGIRAVKKEMKESLKVNVEDDEEDWT